jgi:8-oxo-dGTP diphosphatase
VERKFFLCRLKDSDWFFLPGGHVENDESARKALQRELKEEIGLEQCKIGSFIGACENIFFLENQDRQQELNVVFLVSISENILINTIEDHLEYVAVFKKDLLNYDIRPIALKECIINYFNDEKIFFREIE